MSSEFNAIDNLNNQHEAPASAGNAINNLNENSNATGEQELASTSGPHTFKPKKNSVYHTGDFKTAISRACKALYPLQEGEDREQWFARIATTDLWKFGEELNECLMRGRDHQIVEKMRVVSEVLASYDGDGEEQQELQDQDKYMHMMCSAFIQRGDAILNQRQEDRANRRAKDIEGFFSMAARAHLK